MLIFLVQELGISPVELVTLTVFWAAYQLTSNLLDNNLNVVSLTAKVMDKIIDELLKALTRDLTINAEGKGIVDVLMPGSAVSDLVGLASESFAWLSLYLQAWAKRLQPVTRKKKKGAGSLEHNDALGDHLLSCLEYTRGASISPLEKLNTYLTDHLSRPMEQDVDALLFLLRSTSDISGAPGTVLGVLESGVAIAAKLAARTPKTKQSWATASYVRNIVSSQRAALKGIQDVCTMRLKTLKSLNF